ncbi:hypothetical protein JC200_16920 [Alicyclobacillus sp. ALC3]|nr:hypothetical protein JC200_16920 [Alicyclobacillus sp. ALC3]
MKRRDLCLFLRLFVDVQRQQNVGGQIQSTDDRRLDKRIGKKPVPGAVEGKAKSRARVFSLFLYT